MTDKKKIVAPNLIEFVSALQQHIVDGWSLDLTTNEGIPNGGFGVGYSCMLYSDNKEPALFKPAKQEQDEQEGQAATVKPPAPYKPKTEFTAEMTVVKRVGRPKSSKI